VSPQSGDRQPCRTERCESDPARGGRLSERLQVSDLLCRSEKRRLSTNIIIAIVALAVGISSIIQFCRVGDTGGGLDLTE
jgi:hypothetical protein